MSLPKVHELLSTEVSRKEFLQHSGVIILSVVGLAAFLSRFSQSLDYQPKQQQQSQQTSYGARSYGR